MKRAYIAIGPESSGTRLATEVLIKAGCYGQSSFKQEIDYKIPNVSPIVWRKSIPDFGEMPNLVDMAKRLFDSSYTTQIIVTAREWYPMACSQVKNNHVNSMSDAFKNIKNSNYHIFSQIEQCENLNYLHKDMPYVIFYYESLMSNTDVVLKNIMPMLDLPIPIIDIYNGNRKWFEASLNLKQCSKVKGASIVKISENIEMLGNN